MFESDRFSTLGAATQSWFPDEPVLPPPIEPAATLPVLRMPSGSRFMVGDDGKEVDYREATAMGLYRLWLNNQHTQVAELLDYFRLNDINAIRVLFNLDSAFWRDHRRENNWSTTSTLNLLRSLTSLPRTASTLVSVCSAA